MVQHAGPHHERIVGFVVLREKIQRRRPLRRVIQRLHVLLERCIWGMKRPKSTAFEIEAVGRVGYRMVVHECHGRHARDPRNRAGTEAEYNGMTLAAASITKKDTV